MIRIRTVAWVATLGFVTGCAGTFGARTSLTVRAEINVPIAQMPSKYASWVVEAEGYLAVVNEAYARFTQARADLAGALGVDAEGQAIAAFIRDAVQVRTEMSCQPPSFNAGLVSDCRADANARAAGKAANGQASGESTAGIQANCEARASLSLRPGSCTVTTTVNQHPLLSDAARWAKIESDMKVILLLSAANVHLDGRGAGINGRGNQLRVESLTDLASDPTLALRMEAIQAELENGARAAGEANEKQIEMNQELRIMSDAINAQFPSLRAAVSVS